MEKGTLFALSRLAAGQCGLFSAAQAYQLGISHSSLNRALQSGRLIRLGRSVYRVAGTPMTEWDKCIAAALVAGPGSALSHSSAAKLHGFEYGAHGSRVELTVVRRKPKALDADVHLSLAPFNSDELVTKAGVNVTSPARTLVDLTGRLGPVRTARLLDEGLVRRRWTVKAIELALARRPLNLPGRGHLARLVAERSESSTADSLLEARVFRALRPLAPFAVHHVVEVDGVVFVLDAAWPAQRVAAEVIGRAHRLASREAFDRERRKFNKLAAAGWKVAHLTSVMSGDEMRAAVRKLLAPACGATGAAGPRGGTPPSDRPRPHQPALSWPRR